MLAEQELLRRARAQGILEDGVAARQARNSPPAAAWSPRIRGLMEAGRLDEQTLLGLMLEETDALDLDDCCSDSEAPLPEKLEAWGRFQNLRWVGSGGMGTVYRAIDPTLQRPVALKFVRTQDRQICEQFLREARAQAQVEHKHICRVYQVGELQGRRFIVMQLIDGKPFDEVAPQLDLMTRVRVAQKVALGLHAAHSAGLIHRDIKPANILVAKDAQGEWQPCIVDFGLATVEAGDGTHEPDLPAGTPHYMSPEQAQGQAVDARSDIFSLGATLYEALSGKRPFPGSKPLEVLVKILEREPKPLSELDPNIPKDLTTLVATCLEKDPADRYRSALELAVDLEHFLDGEPLAVLPSSWSYRFGKRLRKHQGATAAIASALALAMFFGGVALHSKHTAAARQTLVRELAEDVEEIEWSLEVAHLSPAHDLRADHRRIEKILDSIEQRMPCLDRAGLAASHYALGRGELKMGSLESAKEHLEKAQKLGELTPQLAYSLGELYQAYYDIELSRRPDDEDPMLSAAREERLHRDLRDPAVAMLRHARAGGYGVPELLDAKIARLEGRTDEALRTLETFVGKSPSSYEAHGLIGLLHRQEAVRLQDSGDGARAAQAYGQSAQAFGAAVSVGRSDPESWLGLCALEVDRTAFEARSASGDPEPHAGLAAEACTQLTRLLPNRSLGFLGAASALVELADWKIQGGRPLDGEFDRALQLVGKARRLMDRPQNYFETLGDILLTRFDAKLRSGEDGEMDLERATDALRQAVDHDPTLAFTRHNLGRALVALATYQRRMGRPTEELLVEAEGHLRRAVELSEDSSASMVVLSQVFHERGVQNRRLRGLDGTADFRLALLWAERALAARPQRAYLYNYIAVYALATSDGPLARGEAPTELARAREALETAIRLAPDDPIPRMNFASYTSRRAALDRFEGRDPSPLLPVAEQHLERGMEGLPSASAAIAELVETYRQATLFATERGQPVDLMIAAAELWIQRGLDIRVDDGDLLLAKARFELLKHRAQGDSAESLLGTERDLHRALEERPDLSTDIKVALASVYSERLRCGDGSPQENLAAGLAHLEEVLSHDPKNALAYAVRAELHASGGDERQAAEELKIALRLNRWLESDFADLRDRLG